MIAGRTGIAPLVQIASEILHRPEDPTKLSLIFACRQEEDLLLRSTLDELSVDFLHKFKVHYILSNAAPDGWKYSRGYVNKDLFDEKLYPKGEDVWNFMCGPSAMLDRGCTPNLMELGHSKKKSVFLLR